MLWTFLKQKGHEMVVLYVKALLDVPPKLVAERFTDVLVALLTNFREEGTSAAWLQAALQ